MSAETSTHPLVAGCAASATPPKLTPEQPFANPDKRIYGRLCLLVGSGFALLMKGFAS